MFVYGARSIAASRQRWINDPDSELVANRKPHQLNVARKLGLAIPRTLMSNDPDRIETFFREAPGEIVMKPFHAVQWFDGKSHFYQFAKKIAFEDIENPEALRLTAHIFQDYVEKRYELRVFCFGDTVLSFKLHTQEQESTRTDWRSSSDGSLRPQPYDALPAPIVRAIRDYMKLMRLEFGAFDFIIDSTGRHVFLECNVSGQFLFIEEWNPDIHILSEFVRFLTRSFALSPTQTDKIDALRYADFRNSKEADTYYQAVSASYPPKSDSRNLHSE